MVTGYPLSTFMDAEVYWPQKQPPLVVNVTQLLKVAVKWRTHATSYL